MIATFRARLLIVLFGQKGQVVELSTNAWSAIVVIAGSMTGTVTLTSQRSPLVRSWPPRENARRGHGGYLTA